MVCILILTHPQTRLPCSTTLVMPQREHVGSWTRDLNSAQTAVFHNAMQMLTSSSHNDEPLGQLSRTHQPWESMHRFLDATPHDPGLPRSPRQLFKTSKGPRHFFYATRGGTSSS